MSHFTVLVIGENPENQLLPFQEAGAGCADEFRQEIDVTEEYRDEWLAHTTTVYRDPAGVDHDPWDNQFFREFTAQEAEENGMVGGCGTMKGGGWYSSKDWDDGKGYRAKVRFLPDGWTEVEVLTSTVESFRDWIESYHSKEALRPNTKPDLSRPKDRGEKEGKHVYGWAQVDSKGEVVKVIDRTNPNGKWDWNQIGGRWAGFFRLKPDAARIAPPNFSWGYKDDPWDTAAERAEKAVNRAKVAANADQARKGDIDFSAMRDAAGERAAKFYDYVMSIIGELPPNLTFEQMEEKLGKEDRKYIDAYWEQPRCAAWKSARDVRGSQLEWGMTPDDFLVTREDYIAADRARAGTTRVILKDGVWSQRCETGWWGSTSDDVGQVKWSRQFAEMLDGLSDDTLLTVVDCHV